MVDGLALGSVARDGVAVGEFPEFRGVDGATIGESEDAGVDSDDMDDLAVHEAGFSVIGADEDPVARRDPERSRPADSKGARPERESLLACGCLDKHPPASHAG